MSDLSVVLDGFIASDVLSCTRILAESIINQIGGVDEFLENYETISEIGTDGGFSGFTFRDKVVPFVNDHRTDMIAYLKYHAERLGYNSLIEHIDEDLFHSDYDMDSLAYGLYVPINDINEPVNSSLAVNYWLACGSVKQLSVDFSSYTQST